MTPVASAPGKQIILAVTLSPWIHLSLQTSALHFALQCEFSDGSYKIFAHQLVQPFCVKTRWMFSKLFTYRSRNQNSGRVGFFKDHHGSFPLWSSVAEITLFSGTYHNLTFYYVMICLVLVICVSPHDTRDSWGQRPCLFGPLLNHLCIVQNA